MQKADDAEKIHAELDRILCDATFSVAPKMSAFLRYVVTQTLQGNSARIKAYSIAVDALDKPSTFDPQADPCVRVMAFRMRLALNEYYERTAVHGVVLRFKPGSYVPLFTYPTDEYSNLATTQRVPQKQP